MWEARVSLFKQPVYVLLRIEHHEVVNLLSDAGVAYRQIEFFGNSDRNTAFGCPVKFSQYDSGNTGNFQKLPRLLQTVLSGYCIDDQQRFVGSAFNLSS